MNTVAAVALAAGELICQIPDRPDRAAVLLYELRADAPSGVLDSRRAGRRPVAVREDGGMLHLIEDEGASVRVTTLTECALAKRRGGIDTCTRFAARHAWHFDARARVEPAAAFLRQPDGAADGYCEPWRVD